VDFVLNCIVPAKSSAFGCGASRLLQAFRGSKEPPVVLMLRCHHELKSLLIKRQPAIKNNQRLIPRLMIFRL
jgi:hypothetical protein